MKAPKPLKATTKAVLAGEMPLSRNNAGVHKRHDCEHAEAHEERDPQQQRAASAAFGEQCRIGRAGQALLVNDKMRVAFHKRRPKSSNDPPDGIGVVAAGQ